MKRKEYNEVTNKIVNIELVTTRGCRVPILELTFKESGHNRLGGHKVYIDYNCAKELSRKINDNIRDLQSKYFANEYYDKLLQPVEQMFC
jgi:hypothetical protein